MMLLCSQYRIWRFEPTPIRAAELVAFAQKVASAKDVGKLCMSPSLLNLVQSLARGGAPNPEDMLPLHDKLIQNADVLYSVAEHACRVLLYSENPVEKNNFVQRFAESPELLGIPKWRRQELYIAARRSVLDASMTRS
jgi:hypothetical protein